MKLISEISALKSNCMIRKKRRLRDVEGDVRHSGGNPSLVCVEKKIRTYSGSQVRKREEVDESDDESCLLCW